MLLQRPERIEKNIDQFTGRTWLLPKLLEWWDKRKDERMFLLTGGPGTGKSMIMAWLAGAGPMPTDTTAQSQLERVRSQVKATHFCIAASGTTDPKEVARQIANQLTRNVPGFGKALAATMGDQVQIASELHVDSVEKGGSVTGIYIGNLNLAGLSEELSFNRILRDPLKGLYEDGYNEAMLLLVDALDEALTYSGEMNIVQVLAKLTDLPPQVRILATTREDPRVLKFFRGIKPFDLIKNAEPDVDDVRVYAVGRLAKLTTVDAEKRKDFAQRLATQAGGVFLYAAMVLDELLERLPAELPDLDTYPLPDGLGGIYHDFLTRELGKDEQRWFDLYEPLLGLIAVAQGEGLTAQQLTDITGKDVRAALRACKQYLSGELPDGPFRPFHKSFADFLLEEEGNADFRIDPVSRHRQIADYYWQYRDDWSQCDAYGLRNLGGHLYALSSDPSCRNRLYEFVSWPVVLAKWQRFGSLESLGRDLSIAKEAATQEKPLNWVDFMRCYLIERTLGSFELSADVFRFIASGVAQSGRLEDAKKIIDQALDLASSIRAPAEKARTLSTIATFLFQTGFVENANEVLGRAFEETRLIKNVQEKSETLSALVLDIASMKDHERANDVACRAMNIAQSTDFSWARAISISSVACALWQVGEVGPARDAFSKALKAAWDVNDNDDRAYALCAVAAAMERAGDKDAEHVFRDARSQLYGSGMPPEEVEDEFNSIYVDYRAKSAQDLDQLFAETLQIREMTQKMAALRSLAERLAKALLYGNYPRQSAAELNIDRLCDRSTFRAIASKEPDLSVACGQRLTLRALCQAILDAGGRRSAIASPETPN